MKPISRGTMQFRSFRWQKRMEHFRPLWVTYS